MSTNFKNKKMQKILLVSQYITENRNYISRLKESYKVVHVSWLETAIYFLKKQKYDLIIVEVSIPPRGVYTPEETFYGLRTGIVFYEKELKQLKVPVIFWSWGEEYKEEISKLESHVIFVKKEINGNHLLLAARSFIGKM